MRAWNRLAVFNEQLIKPAPPPDDHKNYTEVTKSFKIPLQRLVAPKAKFF